MTDKEHSDLEAWHNVIQRQGEEVRNRVQEEENKAMTDDKGLYDKYLIFKFEGKGPPDKRMEYSRSPFEPSRRLPLWFKRSWSFVLSPEKEDDYGAASRSAIMAYANAIRNRNPELSNNLKNKVEDIQKYLGIWNGPKERL